MRHTQITISQRALTHNVQTVRTLLPTTTKILAMVKANAYGHDVELAIGGLMNADGFGVATLDEGLQVYHLYKRLGQSVASKPIVLIEGVFSKTQWKTAIDHQLSMVIHHKEQLDWALTITPPPNSPSRVVWLKYNTGMNRLGFDKHTLPKAAKALHDKGYQLILTSHFACADDKTHPKNQEQIQAFAMMLHQLQQANLKIQGSLCNSAGVFHFAQAHYDWVRVGIALYGASPVIGQTSQELGLLPVMQFSAKIMAVHQLDTGESVGYGALWTADKPTRIGVVSAGYGDGYPRVVKNAWVSIQKSDQIYQAPIVGRVAMDMFMIDIGALPDVGLGDVVVLWGGMPQIDTIAQCANTISYELFCKTSHRPIRKAL